MKNTKKLVVTALLLVIAVGAYFVSGVYAKYVSSANGTASARVAKWSFEVNDADAATENTFNFNLYDTLKEENLSSNESDVNDASAKLLAPGTGGEFSIVLENLSEVSAKYGVNFSVTNDGSIPVQIRTKTGASGEWSAWKAYTSVSDLNIAAHDTNTKLAAGTGTQTIYVQWKWPYDNSADASDTALGVDGTDTLAISASVTATQVD